MTAASGHINQWVETRRAVCYALILALLSQSFVSCAGGWFAETEKGEKYAYSFRMVQPTHRTDLTFQDANLKVRFEFDDAAINFRLQNLSATIARVTWDQVSIGIDGEFFLVRHSPDLFSDTSWMNASVLIAPQGYILETVIPTQNLTVVGDHWHEKDLFQTTDGGDSTFAKEILDNVGKSLELVLRIQFGSVQKDYRFRFEVASVKRIPWSEYRLPKRFAPTLRKRELKLTTDITTGLFMVGFLGIVAFMAAAKKRPMAE